MPPDEAEPIAGATITTVHLLRHGEVHNPGSVLYGRLPGFALSEVGVAMARRAAGAVSGRDIALVVSSPLERARQTAEPIADALGLSVRIDERVVEPHNVFQGQRWGVGDGALGKVSAWRHLYNPFRPSWGEPYRSIADRMWAAVEDARRDAQGHEAVIVSHQLPIWVLRLRIEGRRLFHDPRRRQCGLASLTSLSFLGDRLISLSYTEPAADLVPQRGGRQQIAAGV